MSPERQRIVIAEWCGWKFTKRVLGENFKPLTHTIDHYRPNCSYAGTSSTIMVEWTPDFLNDLNAMHEAEDTLKDNLRTYFVPNLRKVLMKYEGVSEFDMLHATAAQRAKALLMTIGKWEDL